MPSASQGRLSRSGTFFGLCSRARRRLRFASVRRNRQPKVAALNLRRRGDHPLGHVPHLMEGHLREPLARPRDDVLDVLDGVTPDVGEVVCGDLKIVDAVVVIRQDCAVVRG
jgi:hypothetical protein